MEVRFSGKYLCTKNLMTLLGDEAHLEPPSGLMASTDDWRLAL